MKDNPKSNVIVGFNSDHRGEPSQYLKNNQMITFLTTNGEFTVQIKKDYLEVWSNYTGEGGMYIRPQVPNVIQVHIKK